jgi:hypothetical protein
MTSSLLTFLQTITVRAAEDLHPYWMSLIGEGGFGRRTLWLGVIDEEGHPTPVVVPIDDIPRAPTASGLAALSTVLAGVVAFGTPVLMISRPGPHEVRDEDRRWARELTPLAPRWPVHLATADQQGRSTLWPIT